MPITPDRLTRLREFGLSEYAARAYLALLDLGVAEARDVSTLSKVPQAKIYHVLEQLHDKGLAVILPEFPKKYAPVPFSEYLQRIHEEHTRQAQAIDRDREVLEDMFRVVGDTEVGNRGFFTVVRGRRNVVAKIQEMLNDAKRDMLVMGTSGFALRYPHFLQDLQAARKRGVQHRVLVPLDRDTVPRMETMSEVGEVRSRDLDEGTQASRVAILIVDSQRAFLINFLPDDDNLYSGKDIGVFTDQEAMVRALATLVDAQWDKASPLAVRKAALEAGDARELRPDDLGIGRLFTLVTEPVLAARADDGVIVLWNPAATQALGLRADVAIGSSLSDVVADAKDLLAVTTQTRRETRAITAEGAQVDAEANVVRVQDDGGRAYALVTLRLRDQPKSIQVEGEPLSRAPPRSQ